MKIWRIVIKDREDETKQKTYHGEADTYVQAGDFATGLALKDGFERPWVDEVACGGEKDF